MISRRFLKKIEENAAELIHAGILVPDALEKTVQWRNNSAGTAIEMPVSRVLLWLLRALTVFLFLGGAILLSWYHWDEFSPEFRIFLGALPLLPTAAFAFWTLLQKTFWLGETGGTLLAIAFAGTLLVVRNNTQMDWNASDVMRETALMTLLLVWLFDSLALGTLLTMEIAALLLWETELLPALWFPAALAPYLLVKIFSLRVKKLIPAQIAGGLLVFLAALVFFDLLDKEPAMDAASLFAIYAAMLLFAGVLAFRSWGKWNVFRVIGQAAFAAFLSLAGFHFFWNRHFLWRLSAENRSLTLWMLSGIALLFFLLLAAVLKRAFGEKVFLPELVFAPALCLVPCMAAFRASAGILSALFLLCAYVIFLLRRGVRSSSALTVWYGTALLELQALLHFFFPENLSRKTMGWIFLAFSLAAFTVLLLTEVCSKKKKKDAEEKK